MIVKKVAKTWDEIPVDVIAGGEMFDTTMLRKRQDELVREVRMLKDGIAKRDGLLDLQERRIKVLESMLRETKEYSHGTV